MIQRLDLYYFLLPIQYRFQFSGISLSCDDVSSLEIAQIFTRIQSCRGEELIIVGTLCKGVELWIVVVNANWFYHTEEEPIRIVKHFL